jgi:prepilin-type N-terminal cleavage/methylation domain-containing protein
LDGDAVMCRRRSERRLRSPDDEGFSLVELVVTMSVMSVLLVIFTTAILQVYRTVSATQSASDAQAQLQLAFQRTDRELRYASWIALPGKVGTTWYVEYADADALRCGQLRLEASTASDTDAAAHGVLQLVQWTRGTPPASGTRGLTLASMIVTDGTIPPFDLQVASSAPYAGANVGVNFATEFQRLRIQLTAREASHTTQVDTTFTALNTTRDTPPTNGCSEGRPAS